MARGKIPSYVLTRPKLSEVRDCAYCRSSELVGKRYSCKLALPMNARTCTEFRDSRVPSSHPPYFTENP